MKSKLMLLALFSIALFSFKSMNSTTEDTYEGDWELVAEQTPEGDIDILMRISLEDGVYSGKLISDVGDIILDKLSIKKGKLMCYFVYQEGDFELSGNFDGEKFNGEIYGMDMTFTTNGHRVETKE